MEIKRRISPDTVTRLIDLGHTINCSQRSAGMGSLHTVMWEDGVFCGYSDPGRPVVGKVGVV
jgi:gamma-glutamyltranspeptidase